jgi:hypothetical protein
MIMCTPPHTAYKLPPLGRNFLKLYKVAYSKTCSSWMRIQQSLRYAESSWQKIGFFAEDRPEEYKYFYALDFLFFHVMNIPQMAGIKTGRDEVRDTHTP